MHNVGRVPASIAGIGAVALIAAVAACTLLGGSNSGSSGSGPTPAGQLADASASGSGATDYASDQTGESPMASGSMGPFLSASAAVSPAASATPLPATPTPAPKASPCGILPSSNVWNRDISKLPVASNSAAMVAAIGSIDYLHPDFDAIGDGIPYNVVTSSTPTYKVSFQYGRESDPGPYPIPASPKIEKGSDRHLISLDLSRCKLWELYDARKSGSKWTAGSGAVFDLRSNALRPAGWTSADAAGLPIYPGLVRYSEVLTGAITHAIRFTAPHTCGYIYPARHLTAAKCSNLPPMGLRVRLKASVSISSYGAKARIVLTALKKYGMILADNGSPWYISGAPDTRWNDDEFHQIQRLTGRDFEVVNTSSLLNG
jgi:hypothetical protein